MAIPKGPKPTNNRSNNTETENTDYGLPELDLDDSQGVNDNFNDFDDDEDLFTQIPVSEVTLDDDDDDDEEEFIKPQRRVKQRKIEPVESFDDEEDEDDYPIEDFEDDEKEIKEPKSRKSKLLSKKPEKPKKGSKVELDKDDEDYTDDTFIDNETKTLKPFGSNRNKKRKAKVGEFDPRKNMKSRKQAVQAGFIGSVLLMTGVGLYGILFPPKSLTIEEVYSAISTQMNDTGYPVEEGGAYAQDFMKAYLTVDGNNGDSDINKALLGYFYGSEIGGDAPNLNVAQNGKFNQKILFGPTLYSSKALTATSATYTVGALVQPGEAGAATSTNAETAKWSFFNITVYHNPSTNSFTISPESPTVVPAETIGNPQDLPQPKPIGLGQANEDLATQISSVVNGYVKGYAVSNLTDHSAVDQYITDTKSPSLIQGLDSRYTLDGDDESAIAIEAYPTEDPNVVKARVKVAWKDTVNSQTNAVYTSNYIIALEKQTNGKYLVSKMAPEYYIAGAPQ